VAAVYGARESRPRIAVLIDNVDRPRTRFALRCWRAAQKVDLFFACSELQVEFLRHYLGLSNDRVLRETITYVLKDSVAAEARAASGYAHALQLYDLDRYVKEIGDALRSIARHNF
jgi:hypothetical protein